MEEDELRDLEAVEKVRETSVRGMIIDEILCFLLLQKLPILLATLYPPPPCMVESPVNRGSR